VPPVAEAVNDTGCPAEGEAGVKVKPAVRETETLPILKNWIDAGDVVPFA